MQVTGNALAARAPVPTLDTEALWFQFRAQLRRFVARRISNGADVDDIVQWVFLQLHRSLDSLERSERVHAWLYRTTRRAIADYYRSASRRRELPSGDGMDLETLELVSGSAREGVDARDAQQMAACLGPMVEQLPAHYREAITLTELEGLRLSDAATLAAVSLSGMKSRVQRARRRLRRMLVDCCHVALDSRNGITGCEVRNQAKRPCCELRG